LTFDLQSFSSSLQSSLYWSSESYCVHATRMMASEPDSHACNSNATSNVNCLVSAH